MHAIEKPFMGISLIQKVILMLGNKRLVKVILIDNNAQNIIILTNMT